MLALQFTLSKPFIQFALPIWGSFNWCVSWPIERCQSFGFH